MVWMVNNIWLIWKLACILRIDRTCNSMVEFSKYEFNNKLLSGVTLFRVTLDVTWIQPIYICTKKKTKIKRPTKSTWLQDWVRPYDYKIEWMGMFLLQDY